MRPGAHPKNNALRNSGICNNDFESAADVFKGNPTHLKRWPLQINPTIHISSNLGKLYSERTAMLKKTLILM